MTKGVIYGKTTGGGGGYVATKVNPSGALTVESTISNMVSAGGSMASMLPVAFARTDNGLASPLVVTPTGRLILSGDKRTVDNHSDVRVWIFNQASASGVNSDPITDVAGSTNPINATQISARNNSPYVVHVITAGTTGLTDGGYLLSLLPGDEITMDCSTKLSGWTLRFRPIGGALTTSDYIRVAMT